MARPLTLPGPAQAWLEHRLRDGLGQGPDVDFTVPRGEPALAGPDSVSWRVFKNPVTLFIGGVAAVLLELAEPRVRAGVWDHTSFRSDPLGRLRRTGLAAMVTVYGAGSTARAMIAGVSRRHGRIAGVTPEGESYRADDPDLLTWVQATAGFGFLEAYAAYVAPLSPAERDLYYAEGAAAAELYGALDAPRSQAGFDALLAATLPRLRASPTLTEFLELMRATPALPAPLSALQPALLRAAVALLPDAAAARLALDGRWRAPPWELSLVRAAARSADRVVLTSSPAVQACRRLGLPDRYLYPP